MSINKYEIFEEVIKVGSFTKASEVMHITQSAVSHAISSLEKELGVVLFTREPRRIQLTVEGAKAYEYIQEILALNRELLNADLSKGAGAPSIIRIGTFSSMKHDILPKIIQRFNEVYPFIEVVVFEGTYDEVEEWMKDEVIDIGFTISSVDGVKVVPFMKDELLIATSSEEEVEVNHNSLIDFFKTNNVIMPTAPYQQQIHTFFEKYHIVPTVHSYISDCYTIAKMVSLGIGISIGPKLFLEAFDQVVLHELPEKHYREIYLIHQNNHEQEKYIRKFIEMALDRPRINIGTNMQKRVT